MTSDHPIKILFLASDPSDASRLRLGEELRDIQERLQLGKYLEKFLLEQRMSVRPRDISQALLDFEPHIKTQNSSSVRRMDKSLSCSPRFKNPGVSSILFG